MGDLVVPEQWTVARHIAQDLELAKEHRRSHEPDESYWFNVGRERGLIFAKHTTPVDALRKLADLEMFIECLPLQESWPGRSKIENATEYLSGYASVLEYYFA
jgi:hypothetical protein